MSIQVTYETYHISLLQDYCNLKEKEHIRRIINSKKKIYMWNSIIIILIYWKLGLAGPVKRKIKLPSPDHKNNCFQRKMLNLYLVLFLHFNFFQLKLMEIY